MSRSYEKLKVKANVLVASTALLLGGVSCGGDQDSSKNNPKPKAAAGEHPGPTGKNGPALAASIARISREVRGVPPTEVPDSFCLNTNGNPQRMFSERPQRLIVNTLCQPPLGYPASVYGSPDSDSRKIGEVQDGDVVNAICIEPNGDPTRNVLGASSESSTWVKISHGDTTGFISEVNLAYVDDSEFQQC